MSYFERELPPEELMNHSTWKEFRNFGVQWSKLVAWSWGNFNLKKGDEESELKSFFIQQLKKQAKNTEIYVKCDTSDPQDPTIDLALSPAEQASKAIKNLLLGEEIVITKEISEISKKQLTLSEVLEKYTGQPLMTTAKKDVKEMFKEMFNVRVITDSFVGRIIYARDKDATSTDKDKYILELAYPPRPVFSEATLTEEVLSVWVNQDDTDPISYATPPSAYIPWSAC